MHVEGYEGVRNKVRYRDQPANTVQSWNGNREALEAAIAIGRNNRNNYGADGLDMLQKALKSGDQPDLIEASKRRSMRVW
jgi:hypothetical protein